MAGWRRWAFVAVVVAFACGVGAGAIQGPTTRYLHADDAECPTAEQVRVEASARVDPAGGGLASSSRLELRARGVRPAVPPYDHLDLDAGYQLLDCVLGMSSPARLTGYEWADGEARLLVDLGVSDPTFADAPAGPSPYASDPGRLAALDLSSQLSRLWVDLCPERPVGSARPTPWACSTAAEGSLTLTVGDVGAGVPGGGRLVATPPATGVSRDDDGARVFTWRFSGRPPAVELQFETAWVGRAATFLSSSSSGDVVLLDGRRARISLDARFLLSAVSAVLALVVLTTVLPYAQARLLAAAALVAIVGFGALRITFRGVTAGDVGSAVVTGAVWGAIAVLAARRRRALVVLAVAVGGALLGWGTAQLAGDESATGLEPVGNSGAWALVTGGLLVLTVLGSCAVGARLLDTFDLLPPRPRALRAGLAAVTATGFAAAAAFAVGFPFGALVPFDVLGRAGSGLPALTRELDVASNAIGSTVVSLTSLVVVAVIAAALRSRPAPAGQLVPPRAVLSWTALALAVSTPWATGDAGPSGVTVPLWLVTFLVVRAALRAWVPPGPAAPACRPGRGAAAALQGAMAAEAARSELVELDKQVDGRTTTLDLLHAARRRTRASFPGDMTRDYLQWGHVGSWRRNGQRAAVLGSVLAVVPVTYFLWTTLAVVGSRSSWSSGLLLLMISVSLEGARWLVVSFAFGAVYAVLPGRVGPTKALALAGVWALAGLAAQLTSRTFGVGTDSLWLYRSLQLLVFLVALAVAYDLVTVRRGGGGWRQLRELYAVRSYADLTATTLPVVLAVLALGQQVVTGSGLDVAESFVSGLGSVFGR